MEGKFIKQILKRLDRLEIEVFGNGNQKEAKPSKGKMKKFKGVTGGIRLLIFQSFFSTKRLFGDIRKELAKNNYYYSAQAVQSALNRLSKLGGPLVALEEGGKKYYVKRK
jgi:hypothetical protein